MNYLNFNKLSLNSPRDSKLDLRNTNNNYHSSQDLQHNRHHSNDHVLPRINFPNANQIEKLLKMDSNQMKDTRNSKNDIKNNVFRK